MNRLKQLFLLVPLLLFVGVTSSWADVDLLVLRNHQIGRVPDSVDPSAWAGYTTINANNFAHAKKNDQIIFYNSGNQKHLLQISLAGSSTDNVDVVALHEGQYGDEINGKSSKTYTIDTDAKLEQLKNYGLVINGSGSEGEYQFNVNVTLRLLGVSLGQERVLTESYELQPRENNGYQHVFYANKAYLSDLQAGDVISVKLVGGNNSHSITLKGPNPGDEYGNATLAQNGTFTYTVRQEDLSGSSGFLEAGFRVIGAEKPGENYNVKVTVSRPGVNLMNLPYDGNTVVGKAQSPSDQNNGWFHNSYVHSFILKCFGAIEANSNPANNPGVWFEYTGNASGNMSAQIAFRLTNSGQYNSGPFPTAPETNCVYEFSNFSFTDGSFRYGQKDGKKYIWFQLTTEMINFLKSGDNAIRAVGNGSLTITNCGFDFYPNNVDSERGWQSVNSVWISEVRDKENNVEIKEGTQSGGGIYTTVNGSLDPSPTPSNGLLHWTITNPNIACFLDADNNEQTVMDTYVNNTPKLKYKSGGTSVVTVTAWDNHSVTATQTVIVKGDLASINVPGQTNARQFKVIAPTKVKDNNGNLVDIDDNHRLPELPVIISLHGGGGHYNDYSIPFYDFTTPNITDEQRRAFVNENQFLLIVPEGTYVSTRGNGWDATIRNDHGDIAFMKAIVDDLLSSSSSTLARYAPNVPGILEDQVYICGWSNGGMMAYQVMAALPNVFAAGASVGGVPFNEFHLRTTGAHPVPFLHIHGNVDPYVPVNDVANQATPTLDFQTHLNNMAFRNGCYPKPNIGANGTQTSPQIKNGDEVIADKFIFEAVPDGIAEDFEVHYVHGMGHISGIAPNGYNVPQNMWDYFKSRKLKRSVQQLKFRAILKSSKYPDYLGEGGTGFDIRKCGWTINGESYDNDKKEWIHDDTNIIAAYGEGTTDQYYRVSGSPTNWWSGALEYQSNGYTPLDYNFNCVWDANGNVVSSGIIDPSVVTNRDIYHSIQLEGKTKHHIRFKTSATRGDAVTVQIYRLYPTDYDKFGNVAAIKDKRSYPLITPAKNTKYYTNMTVSVDFETPDENWAEYYIEIKKCNSNDDTVVEFVEIIEDPANPATSPFFFDVTKVVPDELQLVRQPVYNRRFVDEHIEDASGQAREYFVFADKIYRHEDKGGANNNRVETITRTVTECAGGSLEGSNVYKGTLGENKTIAVIGKEANGNKLNYTASSEGILLSEHGGANFQAFADSYNTDVVNPLTKGTVVFKVAGTMDFTIYFKTQNLRYFSDDDKDLLRLSVWYMNDLMKKPEKIDLGTHNGFWEVGNTERHDMNFTDGAGLSLGVKVRLKHLGSDGSCFLYFAYEGSTVNRLTPTYQRQKTDDQGKPMFDGEGNAVMEDYSAELWLQGFEIHRPDLKVTVGRTDNKFESEYSDKKEGDKYLDGDDGKNVNCTIFGENQPYVWSFDDDEFIGKLTSEKYNQTDNRTYINSEHKPSGTKLLDHLLVYSENSTSWGHFVAEDGDEPAHLQFDTPTQIRYSDYENVYHPGSSDVNADTGGEPFDPIVNDALKVNVTGSGWFKVRAKVPSGKNNVKMTIMTCPNYGSEHIRLLRYFKLPSDGQYHEYVVFLKASKRNNGRSTINEEVTRQAIFVVFEDIGDNINTTMPIVPEQNTGVYEGFKNNYQVNIEKLEWLNEDPDAIPDYVFQREQYLFQSQTENEDVNVDDNRQTGHVNHHYTRSRQTVYGKGGTNKSSTSTPILYWQAGGAHAKAFRMANPDPEKVSNTVIRNGIVVDEAGNALDDNALENGRWAYDTNWQLVSGGTNPKLASDGVNYTRYGARPHKGNLSSSGSNQNFGGWWDMAPMPTLGLDDYVNSNGVYHPNTDYVYEQNHYNTKHGSPLWNAAHTEMQSKRVYSQGYITTKPEGATEDFEWRSSTEFNPTYKTVGESTEQTNTEFDLPISGPFYRFMPMKNVDIIAYVVPGNSEGSIYVLDETGQIVKNYAYQTDENFERGAVTVTGDEDAFINAQMDADGVITPTAGAYTVPIKISTRAGKEYFLCSKGMAIGVAAMYFNELPTGGNAVAGEYVIDKRDSQNKPIVFDEEGVDEIPEGSNAKNNVATINGVYAKYDSKKNNLADIIKYTDVTINRSFEPNKWYSLVLPFSLNEEKFEEVFGEGAKCMHFEWINNRTIHLLHHRYNMVVAGRPIFIYPTKKITGPFTITDVTIQNVPNVRDFDVVGLNNDEKYQFVGSYNRTTMDEGSIVMTTAVKDAKYTGQLAYMTSQKSTKGLRAWIQPANAATAKTAPYLSYSSFKYTGESIDEDELTGIEQVLEEEMGATVLKPNDKIFDLNGRLVGKGTDINALPSGVYIINGKKIVK